MTCWKCSIRYLWTLELKDDAFFSIVNVYRRFNQMKKQGRKNTSVLCSGPGGPPVSSSDYPVQQTLFHYSAAMY